MDKKKHKQLKTKWLKHNIWSILCSVVIVTTLFICSLIYHKFILVLIAIVLEFALIIYFRNKMQMYIEDQIYGAK